jgi:sigma-B regulation protein RsbU (phosphoserine phosphatase)
VASLTVVSGKTPGQTIALNRERLVLGRALDCDVVLETHAASRQHACIVRDGDAYYVEDLKSRNGTFYNGLPVLERTLLRANDRIQIADWELSFQPDTASQVDPRAATGEFDEVEAAPAAPQAPPATERREHAHARERHPDLEKAAHIQRTLLLGRPTIDLRSQLRADAVSVPSLEVGGDFYEFFAYDQVLDVVLGDVMGKGIQAGMLGAATRMHLLRAVNNLLASNPTRLPDPKDILGLVVADVYRHFTGLSTFVTLVYARFDLREHRAHIIDCGHTKTIHVRGDGSHTLLQGENVPLGFLRADDYDGFTVPLDINDVFFFYTDGITEARRGEEDFGEARLVERVSALHRYSPREIVEKVSEEAIAFSAPEPPKDDVTCLAVQMLDPNRSRGALRDKVEITSDPRQAPRAQELLRQVCLSSPDPVTFADDLAQLQQAVSEVLSHIAVHAYGGQRDKMLRVEASLFGNRFSVRIFHRGEEFDGTKEPALQATCRRVDSMQCARQAYGEHCVHLQKWLKR